VTLRCKIARGKIQLFHESFSFKEKVIGLASPSCPFRCLFFGGMALATATVFFPVVVDSSAHLRVDAGPSFLDRADTLGVGHLYPLGFSVAVMMNREMINTGAAALVKRCDF
jgi:hypothetical protein